ncbi:hypothetical protein [Nostoc sp.]|uniref:hypothetical protein n=1 Tax=Nostoc sp. TaxID=1180 RepID=UPI002FF48326
MPTYLLLDPSSINALIIITLLFEILTLLRVVRSLDSTLYRAVLNAAIAVLWEKEQNKGDRFVVTVEEIPSQEFGIYTEVVRYHSPTYHL